MTDDELLVNLNDYYASIRPDLNIHLWLDKYESPMYHAVIRKGKDLKLRATSERLEELKQVVDFSLNDIYEIN